MNLLATLVMLLLAGVAAAAFGGHFFRRRASSSKSPEYIPPQPSGAPKDSPETVRNDDAADRPLRPSNGPVLAEDFDLPVSPAPSQPVVCAETAQQDMPGAAHGTEEIPAPSSIPGSIEEIISSTHDRICSEAREAEVREQVSDFSHDGVGTEEVALPADDDNTPPEEPPFDAAVSADDETGSDQTAVHNPSSAAAVPAPSRKQSVHRDRRGRRRRQPKTVESEESKGEAIQVSVAAAIAPAEVRLRLELHPIRETVQLFLVLSRPETYPQACSIDLNGSTQLDAYDETRYDDIDLEWQQNTLAAEFRFSASGGFCWVRSARRIHIFARDPSGPGLISVSAVVLGQEHVIICPAADFDAVQALGNSTGSPHLQELTHWQGVPRGWCVLANYVPRHAAESGVAAWLSSLDPLYDLKIKFAGGLQLRSNVFAEGHAPRIEVPDLPPQASVNIDGKRAAVDETGAWQVAGWDAPGAHLVDVEPGPSLSYEILADPARLQGWPRWQPDAIVPVSNEVWTRTSICGASIIGIHQEAVVAHENAAVLVTLGSRGRMTPLRRRSDAGVSVALPVEPPAFLLMASGLRRHQGAIVWLGLEMPKGGRAASTSELSSWAGIVRGAVARRLPIQTNGSPQAKAFWQKAARRARDLKRQMHER